MGVFGTKPAANGAPVASRGGAKKGGSTKPVKTLRVKMADAPKSEYLTGLFLADKQQEGATLLQGKDTDGNRYAVFINDDGSGSLLYTPAGQEKSERLTGLFLNDGQYGPYHSGKTKDGHRFYIADVKPR
jgi:hypothetical protein